MITQRLGGYWILIAFVFFALLITLFVVAPCDKSHLATSEEHKNSYQPNSLSAELTYTIQEGQKICDSQNPMFGINIKNPFIVGLIIIVGIGEIIFLFDKRKTNKDYIMWRTLGRKLESIFESAVLVVTIFFGMQVSRFIGFSNIGNFFYNVFKWIIILVGIGGLTFGYIWLNSLRMRRLAKKKVSK